MSGTRWALAVVILCITAGLAEAATGRRLTAEAVNAAVFAPLPEPPEKTADPRVLRAEILLSRARFSAGVMDGVDGENFRRAVGGYQRVNGIEASGRLDQATWTRLTADAAPALSLYKLTKDDLHGPFQKRIPTKLEAMGRLKHLGYRNVKEMLAERFHQSGASLAALNPGVSFKKVGETITVPAAAAERAAEKATRVVVDKPDNTVEAFGAYNKLLAFYPASIGSEEKPAPSGNFEITRIVRNPDYTYDPAYKFKGVKATRAFRIAPGPNNPVGAVWMDISFNGYGIHGTPMPETIGKTQSHGCVRLTNWDALDLASMVGKGTAVAFQDQP